MKQIGQITSEKHHSSGAKAFVVGGSNSEYALSTLTVHQWKELQLITTLSQTPLGVLRVESSDSIDEKSKTHGKHLDNEVFFQISFNSCHCIVISSNRIICLVLLIEQKDRAICYLMPQCNIYIMTHWVQCRVRHCKKITTLSKLGSTLQKDHHFVKVVLIDNQLFPYSPFLIFCI